MLVSDRGQVVAVGVATQVIAVGVAGQAAILACPHRSRDGQITISRARCPTRTNDHSTTICSGSSYAAGPAVPSNPGDAARATSCPTARAGSAIPDEVTGRGSTAVDHSPATPAFIPTHANHRV